MEIEHAMGKFSKKPLDDNAPKRPLSAYFLFANKVRNQVMKDNPDLTISELGKHLGLMWKDCSNADKGPYIKSAEKEYAKYTQKKEKYAKSTNYMKHQKHLYAWKIHQTKKPFHKDPNAPKRGLSAYMLYSESVREKIKKENPEMKTTEVMKEQSVWWMGLSEKDRKPFVEKAAADKAKYEKRYERYMKTSDYQKWAEEKEKYKVDMKEKRRKLMGIKKKRPRSVSAKRSNKKQKKSKSRSRSRRRTRRSRTPKARKKASTKRRSKVPKGNKKRRSSSRSTSRSRSGSRSASSSRSRSRSSKKRAGRRKDKRSRKRSPKRSKGRKARKAKKRSKKSRATTDSEDE